MKRKAEVEEKGLAKSFSCFRKDLRNQGLTPYDFTVNSMTF